MGVAAPADKRFRRAHVKPAPKRGWRDLSWMAMARVGAVTVVVLYAAYLALDFVLTAEALTVTRITVSGNTRLSQGEVLSLLDGLRGRNMLAADLDAWQQKLMASPWVANAAMRRVLPGTIDVFISERAPMGVGRIGERLYLIDERGEVIDEFGPNYADLDLPIIDGLMADSPRADGLLVDGTRAALAGRLLAALRTKPTLARRVSQVDVSDPRDAMVIVKGDTALVRLGDEQFVERLQSYLDLAPALRERVPDIDYVDLRFDERVYVRPQASGPRAQKARSRSD
jgi:cell division protein FtsQ